MKPSKKVLKLCKYSQWCDRPPKTCFFIHPGDPEFDEVSRREPHFVPIKSSRPKYMPKSPEQDRGWASRRPTRGRSRSRSRDRSPRRDEYRDRRDDRKDDRRNDYRDGRDPPRRLSVSRSVTPPPRSRIPPPTSRAMSPPRPSSKPRGHDNQSSASTSSVRDRPRVGSPTPSSSSHGAASRDKDPAHSLSRKLSTSSTVPMSTNTRPMSPGPSTRPSSAPRPPEGPKADMDSAFKRSGLGQKKADNPFKTPAAPTATPTSSVPNSSTNKPPADSHDSNSILPREPPVQSQKPAWKPVRLSPPSGPSKSESPVVAPPSLDKGKGKEMEIDVSSAPRAVATAPDVVAMSPSEPARVTKEEWLKKIRLLVAAVEMRAKQLDIKSELNNLKRLEERYSVRGEQNQEGRKRLVEELDKKVAAEKAAVANLKELCFRLASGAPGDDEPELQPESNDNDRQRAAEAKEERKRLMETLKQVQADVQQVANNVQGTATILAQHRADVAALSSRKAAHDADGDVNMDAMQIAAGSSSSAQPNPATDPSIRRDIVELKRRIELIEQGLEDARAEVEDARVALVAKIDSLETSASGDQNQDQESAASQANLVERVKALENNLGLVVNEVVRLDETTSAMSLAKLRAQNVKLQERLAELERDRDRRNDIMQQLARRLSQVQAPPLPTAELRTEIIERTRADLLPVLENFDAKNQEALKIAERKLTKHLSDALMDMNGFYDQLKLYGAQIFGMQGRSLAMDSANR